MRASISGSATLWAPRRRGRWSSRSVATSLAISACWHLLVLAVLALAVHPFQLPEQPHAVDVQLLPPLEPPPPPIPTLPEPSATPAVRPPPPPAPALPQARPAPSVPAKPVEVERASPSARPDLVNSPAPPTVAPPALAEPLAVARPAPSALPKPVEIQRQAAPAKTIDRQLPSVAVTQPAPKAESAPPAPPQVQVLTNSQVVQAPVEIRPPERRPAPGLRTDAPSLPAITGEAAGGPAPGGGAAAGVINGGFGGGLASGLRMRLGCASPDTYHLTSAERAECLRRLAEQAKTAPDLGINIPAAKQADYDRHVSCHAATTGESVPSSTSATTGSSVAGLGSNPPPARLRPGRPVACGAGCFDHTPAHPRDRGDPGLLSSSAASFSRQTTPF